MHHAATRWPRWSAPRAESGHAAGPVRTPGGGVRTGPEGHTKEWLSKASAGWLRGGLPFDARTPYPSLRRKAANNAPKAMPARMRIVAMVMAVILRPRR